MILSRVLLGMLWDDNGIVTSDPRTAMIVNQFMRELISDNHLYITKAVGFCVPALNNKLRISTDISRHSELGESYVEVAANLADKVFLGTMSGTLKTLTLGLDVGPNYLDNVKFKNQPSDLKVLCTNPYICRSLRSPITLRIKVMTANGFKSLAANSKIVKKEEDSSFFPMYTHFSISEYVRVLPPKPGSNRVDFRFCHGMNIQDLRNLVDRYHKLAMTQNISEEDRLWLSNFVI